MNNLTSEVPLCKRVLKTLSGTCNEWFGKQSSKRIKEQAIGKLAEVEADVLGFEKFITGRDIEMIQKLMVLTNLYPIDIMYLYN